MSLEPLPNPKKLSYSGLKWQVRELARRMNLLTQMEAKTIESTGAPKFVFSEELARLDVPSVAEVVTSLAELKEDYDESIAACEATNTALQGELDVIDGIITPPIINDPDHDFGASWSRSVTSQTDKFDPDNPGTRPWNGTMNGTLSVSYNSGTSYRFRGINSAVTIAAGQGNYDAGLQWQLRFVSTGIITSLTLNSNQDTTSNIAHKTLADGVWSVEARGINIRPFTGASYTQGWTAMGSFVANSGIEDKLFISQIETDEFGNIVE